MRAPEAADGLRRAAAKTVAEWAAGTDPYRIEHTVQVTSFGGSGTTALCDHFDRVGADIQKGPGHWPFKHRRRPPTADEIPDGFRVVYLLGDPRDAVLSVFRRRIQIGHYEGMHDASPPPEVRERLSSLDAFLAAGIDDFAIADHVAGWRAHDRAYPVLFLRFDRLDEAWDELADFAGLAPDAPRLRVRPRQSDWRARPPRVREALEAMYGALAAEIEAMPPALVD